MNALRTCPQCGTAHPLESNSGFVCHPPFGQSDDKASERLSLHERYKVLELLGSGGFGAVYKASDTQTSNRVVAIKQIPLHGLSAQQIMEATDSFHREVQILSRLHHPQLPHIYDTFSDAEHCSLIMTFIEGQTLEAYVKQRRSRSPARSGRLPLSEVLEMGLKLCTVLAYLHNQNPPIIFRDLKPGNILCASTGQLYLIDFGIARTFKQHQAKDTLPLGSPGFAAPEQYGRAQSTPKADIYGLGALLHYLLSGDDPSDHPFQFAPLHLKKEVGRRQIQKLIQQMVAMEVEHRPDSIAFVERQIRYIIQLRESPTAIDGQGTGKQQGAQPNAHAPISTGSSQSPHVQTNKRRQKQHKKIKNQQKRQQPQYVAKPTKLDDVPAWSGFLLLLIPLLFWVIELLRLFYVMPGNMTITSGQILSYSYTKCVRNCKLDGLTYETKEGKSYILRNMDSVDQFDREPLLTYCALPCNVLIVSSQERPSEVVLLDPAARWYFLLAWSSLLLLCLAEIVRGSTRAKSWTKAKAEPIHANLRSKRHWSALVKHLASHCGILVMLLFCGILVHVLFLFWFLLSSIPLYLKGGLGIEILLLIMLVPGAALYCTKKTYMQIVMGIVIGLILLRVLAQLLP